MKKRLVALLVLALVVVLSLASCGDPLGDWLGLNEKSEYTVSFAGEDINIPSQTVVEGGLVTRPTTPVRDGYVFDNWYKDEAHTGL